MDFENGVSFVDRLVGYQKRFEEHAARLFISESTGWGLRFYGTGWEREESSDSPPSSLISDSSQLEILIQELQRKLYIQYFIIPQKNTWDRFMISQIGFSKLLGPKQLYGPFLDLASSFGLKVDHNDEGLGGFRCRSESNSGKTASYQLCYNVRFVERHNRQNGNPWSFRHTAIYQQMNYKDRVFRSILLHPPNTVETAVKDLLSSMDARSLASHQDPLLVHILMCLITESGWRPFIADLEKEVADLNDKAIYSRVGKMAKSDFLTEFSDAQKMQSIRQRIIRAKAIIDTGIQTAAGLRSFFKAREHIEAGTVGGGLLSELDQYISRLENHQNSFGGLLQVVDGTMVLLLQILDYRHDEGIQRTAIATQGILSAAQVDNDRMRDIARATQRDSQTMKVLTFIAILYLPGTLVASIFSSGIVNESDGNQTGTQRTRQIGLFGLTTVCLTVVTLIGAILWDKKESRSLRSARTTSP